MYSTELFFLFFYLHGQHYVQYRAFLSLLLSSWSALCTVQSFSFSSFIFSVSIMYSTELFFLFFYLHGQHYVQYRAFLSLLLSSWSALCIVQSFSFSSFIFLVSIMYSTELFFLFSH